MPIRLFMILLMIVMAVAVLIGLIVLQIVLAKRENKWLGLVIPVILFVITLVYPLNTIAQAGEITSGMVAQMVLVFLLSNIPTIIVTFIYLACRENIKKKNQQATMETKNND